MTEQNNSATAEGALEKTIVVEETVAKPQDVGKEDKQKEGEAVENANEVGEDEGGAKGLTDPEGEATGKGEEKSSVEKTTEPEHVDKHKEDENKKASFDAANEGHDEILPHDAKDTEEKLWADDVEETKTRKTTAVSVSDVRQQE